MGSDAIFYNNLSNNYRVSGNFTAAITALHTALRLDPNYAEGYNNLGSLYYRQARINEAIPCFEKALRIDPNYWQAHFNLANCLMRQNQVLRAISNYICAYKLVPANTAPYYSIVQNLGMAYISNQQYHEALPLLEIAANIETNNAELQAQLAETYLELGNANKALTQFDLAIKLNPNRAEWLHNLAVLYLRHDDKVNALKYFQQSLTLQPNNPTAKHMLQALTTQHNNASTPAAYVSSLFDQYASSYNQHVKNILNYKVPELLRNIFAKHVKINRTLQILDLGCGTGLCGIYFKDLAKFLVGIDLSLKMLAHAKNLGAYDALCQADLLATLPGYKQTYFDLILAADVLVYCGDLTDFFINCYQTLTNHGHLLFSIEELGLDTQNYYLNPTGRFAHSKSYIETLSQQIGFKIIDWQACVLRKNNTQPINGLVILLQKL